MKRCALITAIVIAIVNVCAGAGRPDLRFLALTDLPNSGIRFKLMPDSVEMPLPPPMTASYETRNSDGSTGRVQMYSPFELWIHDQHAGMWADHSSNMLCLAMVKYPLPAGFKYAHAPREEYTAAAQKLREAGKEWNLDGLTEWASSYLKEKGITGEVVKQKPFKFSQIVRFNLTGKNANRFAYAFRLNKSAAGQQLASDDWFFVYIEANPAVDTARARQAVESEFFGSIGLPPMSASHKVAASETFQAGRTTNLSGEDNRSEEFKRSREVVKQSIANLKGWWYVETDSFIILSNLKTSFRATLNDLQQNIEHLRYAYELLMPPAKPISAVSVIRVPATSAEYQSYVGEQYAWSGGLWMAARRELVIRSMDVGSSKQKRDQMLAVAYHEGFHQYLFYALDQLQSHPWFNEGHACFYEGATLNNSRFEIEENDPMARDVDAMMKENAFNAASLLSMDYKQFYSGSDKTRSYNYASAWLLIYYLRKHAGFDASSPYGKIIPSYYSELIKSRSQEDAARKALEGVDINALQKDIVDFWNTRNLRVRARYNLLFKDYKPGQRK